MFKRLFRRILVIGSATLEKRFVVSPYWLMPQFLGLFLALLMAVFPGVFTSFVSCPKRDGKKMF